MEDNKETEKREELERIKKWIEERRRNMEKNKTSDSEVPASSEPKKPVDAPERFLSWPEHIRKRWLEENNLKKQCSTSSSQQGMQIIRYLDWFEKVPWGKETKKPININNVMKILDKEHFGLNDAKQIIVETLAVHKLNGTNTGLVMLLVGPPGVGKTSIAKSIAKALKRPFKKISLAGMSDEIALRGSDRTYLNSYPGIIMRTLCECGTNAPVILLDEIDKINVNSSKGNCSGILLDILDSNRTAFVDNFLQVPVDLSNVIFICTANYISLISQPLLDRMEVINLRAYNKDEKVVITQKYVLPKMLKVTGLARYKYYFSDNAVEMIVDICLDAPGVREIERLVSAVCRRVAYLHLTNKGQSREITQNFILEQELFEQDKKPTKRQIGFAYQEM